jgi:hypothetical protein
MQTESGLHIATVVLPGGVADGRYKVALRATDAVGRSAIAFSAPSGLLVDTTAPVFSGLPSDTLTIGDAVDVEFSNLPGVACVAFTVDDGISGIVRYGRVFASPTGVGREGWVPPRGRLGATRHTHVTSRAPAISLHGGPTFHLHCFVLCAVLCFHFTA